MNVNVSQRYAGVALNQSLFETVLQALLLNGGEHLVEMYEGSGGNWTKTR